jgi:hypothetical protein
MPKSNNRIESFALADRAIRLQLADDGDPSEVEECLKKALALDPENIEALQEAAHFYDAVTPNARKAKKYALDCRGRAAKVASEMDGILEGADSKVASDRQHPYTRWKGTALWKAVEKGIADLVENRDIVEKTPRAYIVGYICKAVSRGKDRIAQT